MANYAVIENNNIVGLYDFVPLFWNNMSNFQSLEKDAPEFFRSIGWRKIIKKDKPNLEPWQKYSDPIYKIENDEVVEEYTIIDQYTDLTHLNAVKKQNVLNYIREKRNRLLIESDWTMFNDVVKNKPVEWVTAWENYRQTLRDMPSVYESLDVTEYFDVQFPEKPA